MKKKSLLIISLAIIILIVIHNAAFSDSNGMNRHSGTLDENTCSEAGCHGAGNGNGSTGGLPDNGGPGSIALTSNIPANIYTPGTTYSMTITLTEAGCQHFGFSGVAVNSGMSNSGTMTATDAAHTQVQNYSRLYITHQAPPQGVFLTTNPAVINFNWKAPTTNEGPVTFYYDGIAANNNQLNDAGDNVYKGSMTFNPNTPVSAPLILSSISAQTFRATTSIPSVPKRFYVSGQALSNNISISIPSPYELSLSPTGGFSTSAITLTQASGNVNTTPFYVRYNASLSGASNQTVTLSSSGATSKTAAFTGQIANPVINTPNQTTIAQFSTSVGTPSSIDSFTVTFSGLMDSIIWTAPPQFQITTNKTRDWDLKHYWTPFNPIWGLSNFKMYVRYNPAVAGPHSGNVVISTLGGTSQNVAVSGVTIGTGIAENILNENSVKVYPNPLSGKGFIQFDMAQAGNVAAIIYDLNGKKVKDISSALFNKGNNSIAFDAGGLSKGTYMISLETKQEKTVKQIVIE